MLRASRSTCAQFQSTRPARGATAGRGVFGFLTASFNPRAPRGARQHYKTEQHERPRFQSTRPARGATVVFVMSRKFPNVSIHAPRAGRDRSDRVPVRLPRCFNPRAPRGARLNPTSRKCNPDRFQSTRPARGATRIRRLRCGMGLVSIHAPRAGRDIIGVLDKPALAFQSTRPARGATCHNAGPQCG